MSQVIDNAMARRNRIQKCNVIFCKNNKSLSHMEYTVLNGLLPRVDVTVLRNKATKSIIRMHTRQPSQTMLVKYKCNTRIMEWHKPIIPHFTISRTQMKNLSQTRPLQAQPIFENLRLRRIIRDMYPM